MPSELARDIGIYTIQADALEKRCQDLVERIDEFLITEILPQVKEALPEHYSINEKKNMINARGKTSAPCLVSSRFEIHLTLLYDGKPIYHSKRERLNLPREKLAPQLKEMAEKYGLEEISLWGETMQMG